MVNQFSNTQKVYNLLSRTDGGYSVIDSLNAYAQAGEIAAVAPAQLLVFFYTEAELLEAVLGRTAYIAKSRRDKETQQHLLDVINLTRDDMLIFDPFLKDAARKVLESLQAFTREIDGAYLHKQSSGIMAWVEGHTYHKGAKVLNGTDVWELTGSDSEQITNGFDSANWTLLGKYPYTDDKLEFITLRPDWFNLNLAPAVDISIYEAIINYIIYRWFTIVFPEEAAFYLAEYGRFAQDIVYNINANNRPLKRKPRMF